MTNLLHETETEIISNGKSPNDVQWVGNGKYVISWEEFKKVGNVEYYQGYGAQEIARDIMIVGSDWWMVRHEYDGAEGWVFNTLPKKEKNTKSFKYVTIDHCMWEDLEHLNDPKWRKEHLKWVIKNT